MLNKQPIEKAVRSYDGTLDLHSIFYTIQGEGPFSGTPAVFVRLAGCNFQCPWCDTEYTQGRRTRSVSWITDEVLSHATAGLVVISGGEPFRQPIKQLIMELVNAGHYVQIETNGSLKPAELDHPMTYQMDVHARRGAYIVCSPKSGKVNDKLMARACCYKYVLDAEHVGEDDGLPTTALGHTASPRLARPPAWWDRPVYLQPADHQEPTANDRNTKAVIASAMKHGYIVQLQIHKLMGLE